LDESTRKQVLAVPTTYYIRHVSGGVADDVTVTAKSSSPLNTKNITIDAGAEPYVQRVVSSQQIQFDFPHLRPHVEIRITATHEPSNNIEWSTVASNSEITSNVNYDNTLLVLGIDYYMIRDIVIYFVIVAMHLVIVMIFSAILLRQFELKSADKTRRRVAFWLAFLVILNLLLDLPTPLNRIITGSAPMNSILDGFMIYLLIVNYA